MEPVCLWLEFLEVAIHNILYYTNLYPRNIFDLKKKYNVPIHVINHAGLNQYIENVLNAVNFLAKKDQLNQVQLQISDEKDNPLQSYVFKIIRLQNEAQELETSTDPFLVRMENAFQAFLVKLSTTTRSEMSALPENSQFELVLQLKDCYFVSNDEGDDQNFQKYQWTSQENAFAPKDSRIIPLEAVNTSFMEMEMYIEDCVQR
uniref:Mitotic spindle assembly checkpoint protein MAD2B n=2 Tax=Cacopsylla melanoneura TaxID=428564 RepID=A0A8D8YPA4_9HEMI